VLVGTTTVCTEGGSSRSQTDIQCYCVSL